jgi:hypothetical protein
MYVGMTVYWEQHILYKGTYSVVGRFVLAKEVRYNFGQFIREIFELLFPHPSDLYEYITVSVFIAASIDSS